MSDVDCVHLGVMVPHGAPDIGELVGFAIEAIGRHDMWRLVDQLDAAQAHAAVREMEKIELNRFTHADSLQEEKWRMTASLLESFRTPSGISSLSKTFGQTAPVGSWRLVVAYLTFPRRRTLDDYNAYMDQLIADARLPYAAMPAPPPLPADPINQVLLPLLGRVMLKSVDNRTQSALLITALALRAYRVEHGAYPATLSSLAPAYLKAIPSDPFALNAPLQYKLTGSRYVLYSIGPDGKDDGGKPIDRAPDPSETNKNARYFVNDDSKGDIVAGTNLW